MSDIFALQGKSNCGKTETINEVFVELQSKYSTASATLFTPNKIDVKAIIDIPIGGKIVKVGIESQGDPNSRLQASLIDFDNAGCDIIICACRTSGMTVNWINSYSHSYQIQFIQQSWVPNNSQASNRAMALNIISLAGL